MRFAANVAGLTTVSRIARRYGADDAWMRRWGSAMGRRAAQLHRRNTDSDPASAWEATPRGPRRHMAYPHASFALLTALAEYISKTGLTARITMRMTLADVA
jgi:hypothetical protein